MMLAGLMSRWIEAERVRLGERAADLREDVDARARVVGAVLLDEALEVQAVEVLHDVVEDALGGAPVVEDRDRVRVGEAARAAAPRARTARVVLARAIRAAAA